MRIRVAAVADVPAMVELQRAAFRAALVPLLPDDFELGEVAGWEQSLTNALATDGVSGLLAEDRDGLAGLAIFGLNLAALGYARATLWSLRDNHAANAFYDSLGFEPDGATQTRSLFRAAEVRYARSLTPGV